MSRSKCLQNIAALLVSKNPNMHGPVDAPALITALRQDWAKTRLVASNNRVWSNLVATLIEDPALHALLTADENKRFKYEYCVGLVKHVRLKNQVEHLSNQLTGSGAPKALLIKGAVQLFDDLYHSTAHRFMHDIDIYFEDFELVNVFKNLCYETLEAIAPPLASFDKAYIEHNKKRGHHLPGLVHPDHKARVELHHHLAELQFKKYLPDDARTFESAVIDGANLFVPSRLNQLIITLVHCIYGERLTLNNNFRLRGVLEAYLLYQRLDNQEIKSLENHFRSIGKSHDLAFWKYLCKQLFNAAEFQNSDGLNSRARYSFFKMFNQSTGYHALTYSFHFTFRVLSFGLWDSYERKQLARKLADPNRRAVFFGKLRHIFGSR